MNSENQKDQGIRVNCNVYGDAARILSELKDRHIIDSNREAVVQGLLALQERVMKSDTQRNKLRTLTDQVTYLRPWEEIIGTLDCTEIDDTGMTALLTCTYQKHIAVAIERGHTKAPELQQQLRKLLGQRIAILKTDNPQEPLIIRTINETKADKPIESKKQTRQCRNRCLQRYHRCVIYFWVVD